MECNYKHSCPLCQKDHQMLKCNNFRPSNGKPHAANSATSNPSKGKPFLLEGYDFHKQAFLIDGFKYGFHLFSVCQSRSYESPNLLSATQQQQVVDQKVAKELEAHRLAGPFDSPPLPVFRVSPLGIVPKKTPGEFCMIHHLSFPRGESVNDGISHEHSSVQYANVDKAIKLITQTGVGSYLAKTDIKSAFRILPVNPQDYHLLGIKWNSQYYFDKCMPMGCSSSCKTFEAFSTAIEWIAKDKLCIANLIHLLDDFLLIQPMASQCSVSLRLFSDLCDFLGIPMAPEKTFGLCGVLNFACSIVVPGCAFLRRLIDLTYWSKKA